MANGSYIGKISALVTASTADLSRKLQGSTRDVNRFANSVQSTIATASRSAERSLEGIYTQLQRVGRALEFGRNARLNLGLTNEDEARIRRAVAVTEGINKPLSSARRQFTKLSTDVQAAFLPALDLAQRRVQGLNSLLERSGNFSSKSFEVTRQRVEATTEAIQRLNAAQRASSAGLTGNELQFVRPAALAEINASAAASQRAGALPVSQREDPGLRERVRQLAQYRQQIVATAAQVEALELSPQVDQTDLESARRRLEQIIETTRRARVELESLPAETRGFTLGQATQARRGLGLFGSQAGTDTDAALRRARELDAEYRKLPASAQAAVGGLAGIAARVADEVNQTQSGAENLISVLDRLQAKIRSTQESQSTALIIRPPDADVNIAATGGSLVEDFQRLQQGRADAARAALGPAIDAPSRSISSLEGRIVSLKGQLATLPEPLRSQFVPSVKSIEDAFVRLRVQGVNATEEDIQRLITAVSEAERASGRAFSNFGARGNAAQQFRTSFGGAGTAGLNLGIDRKQLQGVGAEIEFVQQKLAGLANDVRGPVVGALQRYRRVVAQTFRNGAQNTEEGRQAIARAREEVIRLAADVLKVRPEKIGQQLKRAGDIGRGGFGNISLGIQQAAFAVDDFFSVTGGLDQRIRAAGNNISQLGFVIGSTEGLVLGIAASIGAQLIAALIKWYNAGVDLQDQQRALNDTLARQKSIVEDLANAYQAVADAIARTGFSDRTKELREQSRLIDEVRKKQQEQTREVLGGLSRDVQRERALIASLERRLEGETDPGERVRIQRRINDARDREREATDRVTQGAAAPAVGAANAIAQGRLDIELEAIRGAEAAAAAGFGSPVPVNFQAQRDAARRRAAESEAGIVEQVRGAGDARAQVARAQKIINDEIERLGNEIDESLGSVGDAQRRRQIAELELLRESVGRDIFRNATNEIAADLLTIAVRASEGIGESLELLSGAFSGGASEAAALLESANQRLVDISSEIEAAQRDGDVDRANALREEAEGINQFQQEIASAARSTAAFAAALDRVSGQLLNTVVNEARSAEERARRERNRVGAEFAGRDDPAAQEARGRAERDFERTRRQRQDTEDRVARSQFFNRRLVEDFEREQLRRGGAGAGLIRDRDRAQAEIDRLERERQEAIEAGDSEGARRASIEIAQQEERRREAQRLLDRQFENSPQGQAAAAAADADDESRRRGEIEQQQIDRGRELQATPAEQAGRQLARDIRSLQAAFRDDPNQSIEDFRADRQRIIDEAFRSTAPAIFGLADQVANAVLQGPSRAALTATDVSSVQGSAELNRLLRGDDPARNQDLVELQKQSRSLDELVRIARENGVPVAQ